jgi:hypothetical protein
VDDKKATKLEGWLEEHAGNEAVCSAIRDACDKHTEEDVEVLALTKPQGAVAIFRAPTSAEYKRFTAGILDDKTTTKAVAAEIMARNCVLYPDKLTFGSWCDRYGGIASAVLKPLTKLAGAELAERGKE